MSTFGERIDRLKALVGTGQLTGMVTFDQVYAFNQHEGYWLNFLGKDGPKTIKDHPGGGMGKFLTLALTGPLAVENFQRIADHVLDDEEGALIRAMADSAEATAAQASAWAPIEFGDLRESDHPQVFDNGTVVYDRPPAVGRLSGSQLKHKGSLRSPHHGGTGKRPYLDRSNARHDQPHPAYGGPELPNPHPRIDRRSPTVHSSDRVELLRHWQESRWRFAPTIHTHLNADDTDPAAPSPKRRRPPSGFADIGRMLDDERRRGDL